MIPLLFDGSVKSSRQGGLTELDYQTMNSNNNRHKRGTSECFTTESPWRKNSLGGKTWRSTPNRSPSAQRPATHSESLARFDSSRLSGDHGAINFMFKRLRESVETIARRGNKLSSSGSLWKATTSLCGKTDAGLYCSQPQGNMSRSRR